ncbi:MAG TPA: zinc ribbon domain-containing protein [Pyrinomonadaceae bacterium]|nr:zinc ribbon domain-containing protein [Pyrinomonadaceae bacterium]
MYCPNCGTKTSIDQNFCRACGLGLEKIALSLTEQLPARVDQSLQARKDRLEKMGVAALSVFGLGLLSFLLYSIGYKLMMSQGNIVAGLAIIGFVIMIACGLTSVVLFARAKELGEEATKRRSQPELSNATNKELLSEAHFEPVHTVTERTTELLVAQKRDPDDR